MKSIFRLLSALIIVSGCNKEDGPQPQSKEIMEITFVNDFIPDPFSVIVFISNTDGTLFADTSFAVNGTHSILNEKEGTVIPDTFMVTLVRYDLYWHSLRISMNTFNGVSSSSWTVSGMQTDTIGQSTVEFTSIPEFSGLVLYSNQGYFNYTSSTNPQTCMIYSSPDDFYMKMKIESGEPRFKWLEGFTPGQQYVLDLASMEIPSAVTIAFPFPAGYFEGRLWGFADNRYDLGKAFLFDLVLAGIQPQDEITLNYPPGRYDNYRTNIMIRESFLTSTVFYSNSTGMIPSIFNQADAEISEVLMEGNQIFINASGQFDAKKAFLYSYNSNNEIYEWNLYAPGSAGIIVVPELSPLLRETFPAIDTTSFVLKNTELFDFPEFTSYKQMLQEMFDSLQPRMIDQLDYSSVVRMEE